MNSNTMRTWCSALTAVGCVLLFAVVRASGTAQSGISEVIVEVSRSAGIFTLELETTIYKPADDGPLSLIVLSHGRTRGRAAFQTRTRYNEQAAALVTYGYVVAIPMRQRFARSDSVYIGNGCNAETNGIIQAEDVMAMLDYMTAQPYVDCNRIVIMGQSHGGLTMLAFDIIIYSDVRGLVNFTGGLHNDTCVDWEGSLVRAFEAYGHQPRYPSLWFYSGNDSYWPKPTPDRISTAYTSADGKGRLVDFGISKNDLHGVFAGHAGLGIQLLQADASLCELDLPADPV